MSMFDDVHTWTDYATHQNGDTLQVAIVFRHTVRGEFHWRIKRADGTLDRNAHAPRGRLGKAWTYTDEGRCIVEERKAGLL